MAVMVRGWSDKHTEIFAHPDACAELILALTKAISDRSEIILERGRLSGIIERMQVFIRLATAVCLGVELTALFVRCRVDTSHENSDTRNSSGLEADR
jgi:hypothetical protein